MQDNITEEMKDHLRNCFLFRSSPALSQSEEEELLSGTLFFAKGECVYESNNFRNALGVVLSGSLRVSSAGEKSKVILRDIPAGETFGAAALFGAGECYVSRICAKTACAVVFIEESTLKKLFSEYPQCAVNYISFLSSKIRYLNGKIEELSLPGAEARLLDHMKKQAGKDGTIALSSNMSSLAKMLGIGRSSLYRALDSLESGGFIAKSGEKWEIIKGEQ